MNGRVINYKLYGWLLAAILLMPIMLGMACSAASSDAPGDQAKINAVNSAMSYIKTHHADAAAVIPNNITFTMAVATDEQRIGYSRSIYSGAGWTVTIGSPVTLEVIYEINADYSDGRIKWEGTVKNGVVTEVSYSSKTG